MQIKEDASGNTQERGLQLQPQRAILPRQLRLGGSSEEDACGGPSCAIGLSARRAGTRSLLLDDSSSDSDVDCPDRSTLGDPPALHSPLALDQATPAPRPDQASSSAAATSPSSSSAAATPLQFSRSVARGPRSGHRCRLSDGSEGARAGGGLITTGNLSPTTEGGSPSVGPGAEAGSDSGGSSGGAQLTFVRSVVARRSTVQFCIDSQSGCSDSSDSDLGGAARRQSEASQLAGPPEDPYTFCSGDRDASLDRQPVQARQAGSGGSSPIVISDTDEDLEAHGTPTHQRK